MLGSVLGVVVSTETNWVHLRVPLQDAPAVRQRPQRTLLHLFHLYHLSQPHCDIWARRSILCCGEHNHLHLPDKETKAQAS
jgi:hypothetical protein